LTRGGGGEGGTPLKGKEEKEKRGKKGKDASLLGGVSFFFTLPLYSSRVLPIKERGRVLGGKKRKGEKSIGLNYLLFHFCAPYCPDGGRKGNLGKKEGRKKKEKKGGGREAAEMNFAFFSIYYSK